MLVVRSALLSDINTNSIILIFFIINTNSIIF